MGNHTRAGWGALLAAVAAAGLVSPPRSAAHQSGASSLHLHVDGERVEGEWELTARDARALLGAPLEREPDALSEEELARLGSLFVGRVAVAGDGAPCSLRVVEGPALQPADPPSVRTVVEARCPAPMQTLRLAYPLLFDLDPQHRGFFSLRDARHIQAGVFHADQQEIELGVVHPDVGRTLVEYAREGVRHILGGADHLLFLMSLLLTATFAGSAHETRRDARVVLREVLWIVTAFTLAHSLTLALAVLGWARLPARPVEVAIALSVFAAAWNNVRPWLPGHTVWLAFGFGLVHGLGFADALVRLGLPMELRGTALFGFNVGVEIGQLAVVALFLPVAFVLRDTHVYRRWVVPGASFAIAWLALVWALERATGIPLLPRV